MVELIFAITIMGIALMAIPNLLAVSAKSGYVTIQQEAISEASAHINSILTYQWDEEDSNESFLPPVLGVSNGDDELDEVGTSGIRKGTPPQSYRKFVNYRGERFNASTTLGADTGESSQNDYDDIDDFNGATSSLVIAAGESASNDYIDTNISISTTVSYNDDLASYDSNSFTFTPFSPKSGTTNIKEVTITLTSNSGVEELNKTIVLRAFSCNIGAYLLERKDF